MALSGLVIEWDLDIPAYSPLYYPIVFAAFTVGPLMLGARAVGWRWSATAIGLVTTGLIFLLQSVFVVLASGQFVLPVSILGGLVVDGLWQRSGYRGRPLLVAFTGAAAALVMTGLRMAYMARFQHIYWPAEAWRYGLPLAVLCGALLGLLAVRAGAALRPLPAEGRRVVIRPGLAGRLAGLLLLMLALQAALQAGVAQAQGHPPRVEIAFGQQEAIVGKPVVVEIRLPESPETQVQDLEFRVTRQQRYIEPPVEAAGPGVFRSTFEVAQPGQWGLMLRIRSPQGRWIAWSFIHVTPPGVPSPYPLEEVKLRTVVDRTIDPSRIPVAWLRLGWASVLAYSSLLGLGVLYALRLAERDGRALLEQRTAS